MPALRHVVVVTAAGHEVGLGHAVRLSGLVARLATPHTLSVCVRGDLALVAPLFPGATLVPLVADGGPDGLWFAAPPELVLVDLPSHPAHQARPFAAWRAFGVPLVAVDDLGGDVPVDLVVNGTVPGAHHAYSPGPRVFAGPEYALLRAPFSVTPWRAPADRAVTIVIGGGDAARRWAHVLTGPALDRSTWGRTTMVVGAAFPERDRLRAPCALARITLRHGLDAAELATLLADSAVALVTGGMIVYEALAVGTPTVAFPLVDDMRAEVGWLAARGACLDLGEDGGFSSAVVKDAVRSLLDDPALAATMSACARSLIDGRGAERSAKLVDELLAPNAR